MPRAPRFLLPQVPVHIVQRGHNRFPCFERHRDKAAYLRLLTDELPASGCVVHAYVLMPNHVHMLITPPTGPALSDLMRVVNQRYGQHYYNRTYERTGAVWQGRFFASVIEDEAYFLRCQRYIELNPVRGRLCAHAADYVWSSYVANVEGIDSFIQPHELFMRLGRTEVVRRSAYEALVREGLAAPEVEAIRAAIKRNRPLRHFPSLEGPARARPRKTKGPEGPPMIELAAAVA